MNILQNLKIMSTSVYEPHEVCKWYLMDFLELPPDAQHNLETLCNNMNIANDAYHASLGDTNSEMLLYWSEEISKIQASIDNLLGEYTPFI